MMGSVKGAKKITFGSADQSTTSILNPIRVFCLSILLCLLVYHFLC